MPDRALAGARTAQAPTSARAAGARRARHVRRSEDRQGLDAEASVVGPARRRLSTATVAGGRDEAAANAELEAAGVEEDGVREEVDEWSPRGASVRSAASPWRRCCVLGKHQKCVRVPDSSMRGIPIKQASPCKCVHCIPCKSTGSRKIVLVLEPTSCPCL